MSNNPNIPGRAYADDPRSAESIPELVRSLATDLSTLFSKELSLAKAEVRQAATDAQRGLTAMAGGAMLAFAGVIFVLLAITIVLGTVIPLWVASLIVGVLALLAGYGMTKAAQNKVKPAAFVPERAAEAVRKDAETAKRAVQ
jgi:uncharacterized membrane protein